MLTKTTKLRLTKTPSDGSGQFEGVIDYNPPEGDLDGERIANWILSTGGRCASSSRRSGGTPTSPARRSCC
jgi:hypothetical protein